MAASGVEDTSGQNRHGFRLDDLIIDVGTADNEFDIFQNMTAAEVQRVAKTYFTPQSRMVLTVMPRGQRPGGDQ